MQFNYATNFLELPEFRVMDYIPKEKACIFYIEKGNNFEICPLCGHATHKIHDRRMQRIKDIPIWDKPVTLIVFKRRFRCQICGKVFLEPYESISLYSRMTKRFEKYLYRQKEYPFKWVARHNFVSPQIVSRNFHFRAQQELSQRKPDVITVLGIDENSFKKGNQYNTVITNILGKPKVIDILPGRSRKLLDKFLNDYPYKDLISFVVIDMCPLFFKSVKTNCPKALIVIDKFHVISCIIRLLGKIRKKKLCHSFKFKTTKKMIMKSYETLVAKEKEAIDYLLKENSSFKEVYEFKEKFSKFYQLKALEEAEEESLELIGIAMQSKVEGLVEFGRLMMKWRPYILNYFVYRVTNGMTEGINNKIKLIKRTSYGFRNFENFRRKVLVNF